MAGLKAGSSQPVDLRSYLDSPLEKPPCSISSAADRERQGPHARVQRLHPHRHRRQGRRRAAASVAVSVSDGPGRNAVGRGTISVLGKPLAPTGVRAVADRVNGGTARVSWNPPAFDGGSPITATR